jgi:hypothetical protein
MADPALPATNQETLDRVAKVEAALVALGTRLKALEDAKAAADKAVANLPAPIKKAFSKFGL